MAEMTEKDVRIGVEEGFTDKRAEERQRKPMRIMVFNVGEEEEVTEMQQVARIMQEFPRTLSGALDTVMREYSIKNKDLAIDSDIDEKTIARIRSIIEYKPKLQTIIQLCIGLRVPAEISLTLIDVSGYKLRFYGIELAYFHIITQKIGCTLEDCNGYLKALGYPQLGENYQVA